MKRAYCTPVFEIEYMSPADSICTSTHVNVSSNTTDGPNRELPPLPLNPPNP